MGAAVAKGQLLKLTREKMEDKKRNFMCKGSKGNGKF